MKEESNPLVAEVISQLRNRGLSRFPPEHGISSALHRGLTVGQIVDLTLAWVGRFPSEFEAFGYAKNDWMNYLMRPAMGFTVTEPNSEPVKDKASGVATKNEYVARQRMLGTSDMEGAESPLGFKYSNTARLRAIVAYMDVLLRGPRATSLNLARAALYYQPEGEFLRTFHGARGAAAKVLFSRPFDPSNGFGALSPLGMHVVLGELVRGLFRFKNDEKGNITGIDPTLAMLPSPNEWEFANFCDTSSGAVETWRPLSLYEWVSREAAAQGLPVAEDFELG